MSPQKSAYHRLLLPCVTEGVLPISEFVKLFEQGDARAKRRLLLSGRTEAEMYRRMLEG